MAATFFGQYLQIKGIVGRDQLRAALSYQLQRNKSLGQLAVESGLLNTSQSSQINLRQRDTDLMFGELAETLGWLSAEDVEILLERQRLEHMTLGQALVESGCLSEAKLQDLLADYHYWNTRNQRECNRRVAESSLAPQVDGFTYLLGRQLQRVFGLRSQPSYVLAKRPLALPEWSWRLGRESAVALVGVEPAPSFMQTLAERQSLVRAMELAGQGRYHSIYSADINAEDFFNRLLLELADDSQLEVLGREAKLGGPAKESLCVGYSVEGEPLQVYFCAA